MIAEGRRGHANAGFNQLATWEDAKEGVVRPRWASGEFSPFPNAAYDRHSNKLEDPKNPTCNGRSNYVFADGHAEGVEFAETWDIGAPGRAGRTCPCGGSSTPAAWPTSIDRTRSNADRGGGGRTTRPPPLVSRPHR